MTLVALGSPGTDDGLAGTVRFDPTVAFDENGNVYVAYGVKTENGSIAITLLLLLKAQMEVQVTHNLPMLLLTRLFSCLEMISGTWLPVQIPAILPSKMSTSLWTQNGMKEWMI